MAPADHSAASSSGCKRGVPADELVQLAPDCAKRAKSKEHAEIAALRRENEEIKASFLEERKNSGILRGKLMQIESEKTRIFEHFNETLTAMGKLLGEKEMLSDLLNKILGEKERLADLLKHQMNKQKALNQHGMKLQAALQVLQGEKHLLRGMIESQNAVLLQNHQVQYNLGSRIHQLTLELESTENLVMVYRHLLIDDEEEAPAAAAAPSETVDQIPNASPPSSSSASGCQ